MSEQRVTYSFGPLERRGLLGPVRAGQAALVTGAGVAAIALLDTAPSAVGGLVAVGLVAAALAASFAPLGGRTLEEWLPLTLAFWGRRLARRRFASPAPTEGASATPTGRRGLRVRLPSPVAPPGLRDVRLISATYRGREIGALSERSGRRLTAVLACRVISFSLLDTEAQERRLARWGLVLSGAGGGAIRRLQWIERTAPAQGDELVRWVHDERDPASGQHAVSMRKE